MDYLANDLAIKCNENNPPYQVKTNRIIPFALQPDNFPTFLIFPYQLNFLMEQLELQRNELRMISVLNQGYLQLIYYIKYPDTIESTEIEENNDNLNGNENREESNTAADDDEEEQEETASQPILNEDRDVIIGIMDHLGSQKIIQTFEPYIKSQFLSLQWKTYLDLDFLLEDLSRKQIDGVMVFDTIPSPLLLNCINKMDGEIALLPIGSEQINIPDYSFIPPPLNNYSFLEEEMALPAQPLLWLTTKEVPEPIIEFLVQVLKTDSIQPKGYYNFLTLEEISEASSIAIPYHFAIQSVE